ncbi:MULTISPECIES: rhamnulokinase family protein [unclassified Crossiella]|uniref:rhamnulokinase n=1 Tax=unclassified Crossiella TaxID=2620835 RepID=UPI001FFF796E|nr:MULTISPECIES: rhamnulokinase family protein [unclassified Crossiella]MCK2243769.1 rhamnulokinase [Crossiella sp. S99.2]MCK2257628.1 rhamnulokinase [Crossiella sp. S99.1]
MRVAAVDLGASSGRVMSVEVGSGGLTLTEVHRFANTPVTLAGTLHWDPIQLYQGVLHGLRELTADGNPVHSIGIDSWAVDYALLAPDGGLLGLPVHYRDHRTEGQLDRVLAKIPPDQLYAHTGLQLLRINTLFQLMSEVDGHRLPAADCLLLIPDLLTYWLTGDRAAERTNASTTQLLNVHSGQWLTGLMSELGIPPHIFPPLRDPGTPAGQLKPDLGFPNPIPVTRVASHDTASAIAAVPAQTPHFAYISCGTWALAGVELDHPVLTPASREANFTNERGLDGTIRYLRNNMGLWLLQECLRTWNAQADLTPLLTAAADLPTHTLINPDDPIFLPPGDMPTRIRQWCATHDQPVPHARPQLVRCILDSLANAFHHTITEAAQLSGARVEVVHLVGGGAANGLLCQLTANACQLPVIAGPVEAAALGNALVQLRTDQTLPELRDLVRTSATLTHYPPR